MQNCLFSELQFCLVMMQQSAKADSDKTRNYADYSNPPTTVFPGILIAILEQQQVTCKFQ
jgi:hypothetical protein